MARVYRYARTWANSKRQRGTGDPGMLPSVGLQRVSRERQIWQGGSEIFFLMLKEDFILKVIWNTVGKGGYLRLNGHRFQIYILSNGHQWALSCQKVAFFGNSYFKLSGGIFFHKPSHLFFLPSSVPSFLPFSPLLPASSSFLLSASFSFFPRNLC